MGGFTVNGCGATDSFYPVKDLGYFSCPQCGQTRMLSLMEVKRKIRVLYIPTVSISTKYAVACAVCKNGYYISDQQKEDLLYDRAEVTVTSEGLGMRSKEKPQVIDIQEDSWEEQPPEERRSGAREEPEESRGGQPEPAPARRFCGRCGNRLDEWSGLCPHCSGTDEYETQKRNAEQNKSELLPEKEEKNAAQQSFSGRLNRKICPVCGLIYASEKTVCGVCGTELAERK